MRQDLPLGDFYIPIPGTDLYKIARALSAYLKIDWSESAPIIDKVMEAYPAASKVRGVPYQDGTPAGEWMVQNIASSTGISFGRTKAALQVMQKLAASGDIKNVTYNPGQFSTSAKVASAISSAAKGAVQTAQSVVPKSVQDALEGLGKGVSGMGDILQYLPVLAVAGLGVWAWQTSKKGRG